MPELSLIIPAYNEAESLPLVIERMHHFDNKSIEVIIVDNGSSDGTSEVAINLSKKFSFLRVVRAEQNLGYGGGIAFGIRESKGSYLAWTHADLQTDPNDVIKAFNLAKAASKDNILVKGARKNRKLMPSLLSALMQTIASVALNVKLNEINAQPKLFTRKLYSELNIAELPKDFSLDLFLYVSAIRNGADIIEIPVDFGNRQFGVAKGGGASLGTIVKISIRTLIYILKIRFSSQASKYENSTT